MSIGTDRERHELESTNDVRYIGSKSLLVPTIRRTVSEHAQDSEVFCDLFAGTGVVGAEFASTHRVIANDILYFSYVLNYANLLPDGMPRFGAFVSEFGCDPIEHLNLVSNSDFSIKEDDFIAASFSPAGSAHRMYFTSENAIRIDRIRQELQRLHELKLLNLSEFLVLLAGLLNEVPSVSNTTGTYGAFLKTWDKRALRALRIGPQRLSFPEMEHRVFNEDANSLIRRINGDVLYLDTPYNARQYSSNYHLLETIARYDSPALKGMTGLRVDRAGESGYCRRGEVYSLYENLLKLARFRTVVISYSSDGLLNELELVELVKVFSGKEPVDFLRLPYRRYKRLPGDSRSVDEYLIVGSRDA